MFRWLKRSRASDGSDEGSRPAYPPIDRRTVIYAIGDVHGRADLLNETFEAIDRDRARQGDQRHLEVYLGDYVDRGPDSAVVLRRLRDRAAGRPTRMLMGNHEAVLLQFLDGEMEASDWLDFGGATTATSYGVDPRRVAELRDALTAAIATEDLDFLRKLRGNFKYGPYVFVHAGLRPRIGLEQQSLEDMLWIRDKFLTFTGDFGFIVVHGHTPHEEPEFRPNRINIDTGAFATNRLTCLRIDATGAHILGG